MERTVNIWSMFVTREVSQLSGWLKAYANCRGSQTGHTVRGAGCGLRAVDAGERGVHACRGGEGARQIYRGGTGRAVGSAL